METLIDILSSKRLLQFIQFSLIFTVSVLSIIKIYDIYLKGKKAQYKNISKVIQLPMNESILSEFENYGMVLYNNYRD